MAPSVPLSRLPSRVRGGSAFRGMPDATATGHRKIYDAFVAILEHELGRLESAVFLVIRNIVRQDYIRGNGQLLIW